MQTPPTTELQCSFPWTRTSNLKCKNLTVTDKLFAVKMFLEEQLSDKISCRSFVQAHGIPRSTFRDWVHGYETWQNTGMLLLHETKGKPKKLDEVGVGDLKASVIARVRAQNTPSKLEFKDMVKAQIVNTRKRKGIDIGEGTCSDRYIYELKKKFDFSEGVRQFKTHARITAEADPRNAYSMYVMVKAFCSELYPEMIFNWDATQYVVEPEKNGTGIFIKSELPNNSPLTAESEGGLAFAIKLYHFHNAAGYCAPTVFVIADDSMGPEEFKVFKVPKLTSHMNQDSCGWLCFTKTRSCNSTFYRWFANEVVVPHVKKTREGDQCQVGTLFKLITLL